MRLVIKIFEAIDTDFSDYISEDEFNDMMHKFVEFHTGQKSKEKDFNAYFKKFDKNHDGKISF